MASVTFTSAVGGDGSTITDDSNPTTGLASGGHRVRFVPALAQVVAVAQTVLAKTLEALGYANAAASSAAAAAASAADAAISASEAGPLRAFPVNAIYITATNTSPASFLGGTWAQIAAGRTLIGVGTLGDDTYAAGATGGEARHTLTVSEMPSHDHAGTTASAGAHSHGGATGAAGAHGHDLAVRYGTINDNVVRSDGYAEAGDVESGTTATDTTAITDVGDHQHSILSDGTHEHAISAQGGGQAHENRMPFLVVYFWQRTA